MSCAYQRNRLVYKIDFCSILDSFWLKYIYDIDIPNNDVCLHTHFKQRVQNTMPHDISMMYSIVIHNL